MIFHRASNIRLRLAALLTACLLAAPGVARQLGEDAFISLLTVTPGERIYSKFGHTALRVCDPSQGVDVTFNYGVFSFYSEGFLYHFVTGQTDYELGIEPTDAFMLDYALERRPVYEQVLDLDSVDKNELFQRLIINSFPENCVYRYNFVFDNCATRPYWSIVNLLGNSFRSPYPTPPDHLTFRQAISRYTGRNSWTQLGIDIVFGRDADEEMHPAQRVFLPEELMNCLTQATVHGRSVAHGLTASFPQPVAGPWVLSPACLTLLLVLLVVGLSVFDLRWKRISWWLDGMLYTLAGLFGLLIAFLWIFSEHPFVSDNLNILFFNPLLLVLAVMLCSRKGRLAVLKIQPFVAAFFVIAAVVYVFSRQHTLPLSLILAALFVLRAALMMVLKDSVLPKPVNAKTAPRKSTKRKAVAVAALLLPLAASAEAQPKLVVVAVVDGLSQPSIDRVQPLLGKDGFNLYLSHGTVCGSVDFPHLVDGGIETVSTLLTGTTPALHGIVGSTRFDKNSRLAARTLNDERQNGIGTSLRLSAEALRVPSLPDLLRTRFPDSRIYAVGIDGETTVTMAGHRANGAVWMDDEEVRWVSTGYYSEGLFQAADEMNSDGTFAAKSNQWWKPLRSIGDYQTLSQREQIDHGFAYMTGNRPRGSTHAYFTATPAANELVVDLALKLQEQLKLGQQSVTDLLLLQLTANTPAATGDYITSAEQEDMYVRLDQELARLHKGLTKVCPSADLLMVVVGRPLRGQWDASTLPTGNFNPDRAAALVNTYLMALYGTDRWVDGGHAHQIYLNRQLIEQRHLVLADVQRQVAQFMVEFEGVRAAYAAADLPMLAADPADVTAAQLSGSFGQASDVDVVFTLRPGWTIEEHGRQVSTMQVPRPRVPLMLYGSGIPARRTDEPTPATWLLPELCRLLCLPFGF